MKDLAVAKAEAEAKAALAQKRAADLAAAGYDSDEDAPRMVDDMSAVLYPAPPLAGASARGSALQRTRDGSRASGRGGGAGKTSGVGG